MALAPGAAVGIDPASNTVKLAPGGEMYFQRLQINGAAVNTGSEQYAVPEGKRLVIEHVSALVNLNPSDRLTSAALVMYTPSGVTFGYHYLPVPAGVSNEPVGNNMVYSISQPLRMYLDAGYKYKCQTIRNTSVSGNISAVCMVSGYLIGAQ